MVPTPSRAPDRRQRKTRSALHGALVDLVAESAWGQVTVEDVTSRADVARATFYAHYPDKQALLVDATRSLLEDLGGVVSAVSSDSAAYTGRGVGAIFEHADEHRGLYRAVLSGEGGAEARRELVHAFEGLVQPVLARIGAAGGRTPRLPLETTTTAFVGALLLSLERRLERGGDPDPDEADDFVQMQAGGLEWALGYEPGEARFVAG